MVLLWGLSDQVISVRDGSEMRETYYKIGLKYTLCRLVYIKAMRIGPG